MKRHRAILKFGQAVRKERRLRNVTLEELAFAMKTDPAWLSRVERGEKEITLVAAIRIAEALELPIIVGDQRLTR
jgi:transcriptional regulator with XRE-family HTH domain